MAEEKNVAPAEKQPKPKKEKQKRPGGTKNLEKELSALERAIAKAEESVASLDEQMEQSASDYEKTLKQ